MNRRELIVGGALCLVTVVRIAAAQPEPPRKVPIVVVVGCLGQEADTTWIVSSATNPFELGSKTPPPSDADAAKLAGTNRYRLIGTSEFSLPTHKGHKVRVEGLLIQAKPMNRLNITSVRHVADTCSTPK